MEHFFKMDITMICEEDGCWFCSGHCSRSCKGSCQGGCINQCGKTSR